ncbi:MAG: ABC transporter permease [bacterium]
MSDSIQKMFFYIALLAIAIAAMGLFALVSLNIARRTKEIGIRKVLGASSVQIMALVNNAFIRLLIIAALFASIAGYFTVQAMLASIYAYYVGFSATPFVLAILSILVIAMLTVGSQIIKAALANPVDALRYE